VPLNTARKGPTHRDIARESRVAWFAPDAKPSSEMLAWGRKIIPIMLLAAWIMWPRAAGAQSVSYVYDADGQLNAVANSAGNCAAYQYDAAGNLLGISRGTAVAFAMVPTSGAAGTTVHLYGCGFSATPSQDTVTFNGVNATVASATTTQLVVTVPSSATAGLVSVTTPSGSNSSIISFTP